MADETGGSGSGKQMRVDSALVRELAELLSANELTEIEVEDGDRKIRVRRELTMAAAPVAYAAPVAAPIAAAAPAHPSTPTAAASDASAAAESLPAGDLVRSPMVGTCYLSAEPGSKPFATPGETVKEGDTLLIVEAMKVMNPITAPRGGIVRQLLVANAQPVEFDQPLVVIE
ncbi:MAG: Biotin carboxyl carrier protein of acetyl-CoA carboxylase [uncultured Sphingomonas sp.]|uniref:Biotin carboxyl carrier protein of acetyl-CoA carboxylase n=1 Tax=uncultured Sphingomonas sp. TaxID=158754 RepID=A0A6J4SPB6_9SPHN|nr:acetyl-CoA carboxylase biotin carboxyl carrier protein [uncultured Sphingomonas sp.]CAA9500504.1 MAG: Biotin carboxyl carrier protein of acetyl-CoA carboxylase [uncultured Sphingomonas sp.]